MAENRRDQEDSDSSGGEEEQWRRMQTVGKRQQKPCPLDDCPKWVVYPRQHMRKVHKCSEKRINYLIRKQKRAAPSVAQDSRPLKKCVHCGTVTQRLDQHMKRAVICRRVRDLKARWAADRGRVKAADDEEDDGQTLAPVAMAINPIAVRTLRILRRWQGRGEWDAILRNAQDGKYRTKWRQDKGIYKIPLSEVDETCVIQTVACEVDSENVSAVSFIGELILFNFNSEDEPIQTNQNSDENMEDDDSEDEEEEEEEERAAENGPSTSQAVRMIPYKHTLQPVRKTPSKHTEEEEEEEEEDDSTGPDDDDDDNDVNNNHADVHTDPADVHTDEHMNDVNDDDDADVTLQHDIREDGDDDDDDEATLANKYKVILRLFRQWLASMDGQCTNYVTAQMYITCVRKIFMATGCSVSFDEYREFTKPDGYFTKLTENKEASTVIVYIYALKRMLTYLKSVTSSKPREVFYQRAIADMEVWQGCLRKKKTNRKHKYAEDEEERVKILVKKLAVYYKSDLYTRAVKVLGSWSPEQVVDEGTYTLVRNYVLLEMLITNGHRTGVATNMTVMEWSKRRFDKDDDTHVVQVRNFGGFCNITFAQRPSNRACSAGQWIHFVE